MQKIALLTLSCLIALTHTCQNPFLDKRDLFIAIQSNKPEEVIAYTSLIERKQGQAGLKEALSMTNNLGLCPLGYATALAVDRTIIWNLLQKGSDIDFKGPRGDFLLDILLNEGEIFLRWRTPPLTPERREEYLCDIAYLLLNNNAPCTQEALAQSKKIGFEKLQKLIESNLHDDKGETPLIQVIKSIPTEWCLFKPSILVWGQKRLPCSCSEQINALHNNKACLCRIDNTEGKSPLHYAASKGYTELIERLIKNNANPNQCDNYGETPIFCVMDQDPHTNLRRLHSVAKPLLKHGAHINHTNNQGETVLYHAVRKFRCYPSSSPQNILYEETALCWLLDLGANAADNHSDEDGLTLVHHAVLCPSAEPLKLLLEHGAPALINIPNKKGQTALHLAMINDLINPVTTPDMYRFPYTNGSEYIEKNPTNTRYSVINTIIQLLASHGADFMAQDKKGNIPLHYIEKLGDPKRLQTLLDCGGNTTLCKSNVQRSLPIHKAAQNPNPDIMQLLIDSGSPLDPRNNEHDTPLFIAVQNNNNETAKSLCIALKNAAKSAKSLTD